MRMGACSATASAYRTRSLAKHGFHGFFTVQQRASNGFFRAEWKRHPGDGDDHCREARDTAGRVSGPLHEAVWGEPYTKADRSVDVYVGKLRQKLEQASPGCSYIHTHFGFGYRLASRA